MFAVASFFIIHLLNFLSLRGVLTKLGQVDNSSFII